MYINNNIAVHFHHQTTYSYRELMKFFKITTPLFVAR